MTWYIDGRTFAKKVKNPTYGVCSNITNIERQRNIECPSCGHNFDQSNFAPEWPGLPSGVKFDPTDQELLGHLAAKAGLSSAKLHPFVDEFIPTLDGNGVCSMHPENLPGVRHDGSSIHIFHRPSKAYSTGTRKRRKVEAVDDAKRYELRWHKTGKTRPISENGRIIGWKKILVLYTYHGKSSKPEKSNWVMHQYHLGAQEEESDGDLVVSKIFFQTQPRTLNIGCKEEEEEVTDNGDKEKCITVKSRGCNVTKKTTTDVMSLKPASPLCSSKPQATKSKGLLATLAEDVHRLNATLFLSSQEASQSSHHETMGCDFVVQGNNNNNNNINPNTIQDGDMQYLLADLPGLECHQPSQVIRSNQNVINPKSRSDQSNFHLGETSHDTKVTKMDTSLENIILDTPPEFLMESFGNSQEMLDWLGKKLFCSDSSQKSSDDIFDFIKDNSQCSS